MKRVLVVDDNRESAYYLRSLLESENWVVDEACHGAEALSRARTTTPDLVISDLLMPVMDGFSLLRRWKQDERLCDVPFVVYTATYTDAEDEQLARRLGADAFVLKPAEPEALLEWIRGVRTGATPRTPPPKDESNGALGVLREYSDTLVRKLEQKTLQLEESNRRLQQDIEARVKAESALRESEARLLQLAEAIDEVFWLSDLEHQVFYVSPAYETIWGRSCESLYAAPRDWIEAIHPRDRERVQRSLASYTDGTWDETFRVVRPDGGIRWVRARNYPVRNAEGELYRVAGVARDVTEVQQLEVQFRHAQKMEAIGRLAGGIAHDFNNLLSVILSCSAMALDELEVSSPAREDVEHIQRAGERAGALTHQLLAFSRQQGLQPRIVDLAQVVCEMEPLLRRTLGDDVEVELSAVPGSDTVRADPSQVEQVLMNLAVNAREAMPRGGQLCLSVVREELTREAVERTPGLTPGAYVRLTVSDTGTGMDSETLDQVFEPFFTTKGTGTGLGLSTVFGIVKQSQGHIGAVSEPGRGSTFTVYLPLARASVEPERGASVYPESVHGNETILLVEDDPQVREVQRSILARHGYEVLDAQNAGEALMIEERVEGPIHLLVADVGMPRIGGWELARRLLRSRPSMRVLFVSGSTGLDPVLEPTILSDFLAKPSTPDRLLRKVRELLDAPTPA